MTHRVYHRLIRLLLLVVSVAGGASQAAFANICLGGTSYHRSLTSVFNDAQSWRQSDGGIWATEYPWGRTNPGADDAAFHLDETQGLGYDPFSYDASTRALAIQAQTVEAAGLQSSQVDGYNYVSGVMSTAGPSRTAFAQGDGYVELDAKLPSGQGFWPSFWALQIAGTQGAEVDAFEVLDTATHAIYESWHNAGQGGSTEWDAPFSASSGFHRYGVLIASGYASYYVDGAPTGVTYASPFTGPAYWMISFSIGGVDSWPGPPDASTSWPGLFYVRAFKAWAPTGDPCSKE